jgi:hypothetical protein
VAYREPSGAIQALARNAAVRLLPEGVQLDFLSFWMSGTVSPFRPLLTHSGCSCLTGISGTCPAAGRRRKGTWPGVPVRQACPDRVSLASAGKSRSRAIPNAPAGAVAFRGR